MFIAPCSVVPLRMKDATRSRLKEMVREIGERRDVRDDLDGPVSTDSLWAAKPDLDMQQVTAQVRAVCDTRGSGFLRFLSMIQHAFECVERR